MWAGTCVGSRVRISRSAAPSPSTSGTCSRGLRTEAFLPKLLGWLHRVPPKSKHGLQTPSPQTCHGLGKASTLRACGPHQEGWMLC